MSLILPRKRKLVYMDECVLVGVGFGKIGARGELGITAVLKNQANHEGFKFGRQLTKQEFLRIRDTVDKALAGFVRDATQDSELV